MRYSNVRKRLSVFGHTSGGKKQPVLDTLWFTCRLIKLISLKIYKKEFFIIFLKWAI